MAEKPISTPLPADLPTNWQTGQTVSPTGTEVGLTQQHGYNYQSQQINNAQTAINTINDAFENVYGDGDTVPVADGGTGAKTPQEALVNLGAASNPNLLDNWYFVGGGSQQGGGQFPINQRGQTSYTGKRYGIDRWEVASDTTLSISSERLTITPVKTGGYPTIRQYIENVDAAIGKTFTASVLLSGISGATATLAVKGQDLGSGLFYTSVECTGETQLLTATGTIPEKSTTLTFEILIITPTSTAQTVSVFAAKLELGSVQTLAHQDADGNWVLNDPPPNFQQELAKCQRYQVVLKPYWKVIGYGNKAGTQARIVIPVPVPLRTTPTLSISDYSKILLQKADGTQISPASGELSLTSDNENQVSIMFTLPENTDPPQTYYLMYCNAPDSDPATIIFNANL